MSAEPQQYVIADLLANAIEPWDSLTARETGQAGARLDADSPLTAPIVIAAYQNKRGPILFDGIERLHWLASPPRNQKIIPADDVTIEPAAVDEESAAGRGRPPLESVPRFSAGPGRGQWRTTSDSGPSRSASRCRSLRAASGSGYLAGLGLLVHAG